MRITDFNEFEILVLYIGTDFNVSTIRISDCIVIGSSEVYFCMTMVLQVSILRGFIVF